MKESTRVLLALAAAVAIGTAIAASGNATLLRAADVIAPIGILWVNAIRMTVIPLMISLLITGIASAADVKSQSLSAAMTTSRFWRTCKTISAWACSTKAGLGFPSPDG